MMTLTTQSKRGPSPKELDEVEAVIEALQSVLSLKEAEQLRPVIQDIENKARELVRSAPSSARDPKAVAAAAVYEACLQFSSISGVRVTFPTLDSVSDVTIHMIRGAHSRLFKRTVGLLRHRLDLMMMQDDMALPELVHEAVRCLRKGVKRTTPAITNWFARVEGKALQLVTDMRLPEDVHPEVAAVSAIYEASRKLNSIRLVKLTLADVGEVCGMSATLVGKNRKTLFNREG